MNQKGDRPTDPCHRSWCSSCRRTSCRLGGTRIASGERVQIVPALRDHVRRRDALLHQLQDFRRRAVHRAGELVDVLRVAAKLAHVVEPRREPRNIRDQPVLDISAQGARVVSDLVSFRRDLAGPGRQTGVSVARVHRPIPEAAADLLSGQERRHRLLRVASVIRHLAPELHPAQHVLPLLPLRVKQAEVERALRRVALVLQAHRPHALGLRHLAADLRRRRRGLVGPEPALVREHRFLPRLGLCLFVRLELGQHDR